MPTITNNTWDSYFQRAKEGRRLRREARNNHSVRSTVSVGAKEAPERRVPVEETERSKGHQTRGSHGKKDARPRDTGNRAARAESRDAIDPVLYFKKCAY